MKNRRNDALWLLYAEKQDIEARAFRDAAAFVVKVGIAVLIGFALIPLVMP